MTDGVKTPEQFNMKYIAELYKDAIDCDRATNYKYFAYIDTLDDDVKAYKKIAKALNITFNDCHSNKEAYYDSCDYYIKMDFDSIEVGFINVKIANLIMKKICNALEIDIDDYPITDSCGNIVEKVEEEEKEEEVKEEEKQVDNNERINKIIQYLIAVQVGQKQMLSVDIIQEIENKLFN